MIAAVAVAPKDPESGTPTTALVESAEGEAQSEGTSLNLDGDDDDPSGMLYVEASPHEFIGRLGGASLRLSCLPAAPVKLSVWFPKAHVAPPLFPRFPTSAEKVLALIKPFHADLQFEFPLIGLGEDGLRCLLEGVRALAQSGEAKDSYRFDSLYLLVQASPTCEASEERA